MARVQLNIVALGDFTSVNSQIVNLKTQVELLNKSLKGVGITPNLAKQLNEANAAFKATMLSTGQFTASTVTLKTETENFGHALVNGKLKLSEYFGIIRAGTSNATTQMRALALEQTKLQNSIVMADPTKQGVLSVFTPTKINEVANATKIASNMQNIYNIAVDKGTQSLINWGKNTQWAGRQLTVGMTVPLMLFGTSAFQTFKQVNDEVVRLQKVYGTGIQQPTQAALDAIKKQVLGLSKELASTMGIAVKDTAAMAADLAATGFQGNDLVNATRESMRLQKLGEMDQQSAMQTTISLQNVYKLSTNQLSGAIDFLNAVENQTSTSMQDLAAGIPKVGPIVQQLGGSFKDTAIMMVAMKEAGVPAAQSANAIKSALASLINPTKAAKEAFAAYNIDLSSIATKTGGNPVQMIMMLQNALKGLQPLAQARLIEKLFGKFQEARIQALISNLGAVNSQTKQAFDLMNSSETQLKAIASGELKTATESVTGKFRRAVETMKADLLPVGEKIMSIATTLLNFGNSVANVFAGLPGPVKTVMGILAAGIALSGPIIMFTGVLANFVGYLMKGMLALVALKNGTKTFGSLFTPEIIASQNAAALFSTKIMEDEAAVSLLNKAVRELVVSLEGMSLAMGSASSTSFASKVIAAEAGFAGGRIPFKAPKLAGGGFIPGSGNSDSYPAMLMPGEAVIPKGAAQKYAPFINGMINGNLPGYSTGLTGPRGSSRDAASAKLADEIFAQNPGALELQQQIIQQEIDKMGNVGPKAAREMLHRNISHAEPKVAGENSASRWGDPSKLYGLSAPENQALNLLTRNQSPNNVKAFSQSMDTAIQTMINQGFSESEIKSAARGILNGKQPISKLELKLFNGALSNINARIDSGELIPGKNFGAKTPAWTRTAQKVTEARLSGALPMPSEMNLAKALNIASKSASPSKVTQQAAQNMVNGVVVGLKEGETKVKAVSSNLIGPSMANGQFESNSAASPGWRSRLNNSQGKLSLGAKMGGSMALMMGGQMAGQMLPQGSVASGMMSSVTNMAGMGMMFGPWGAAAGAAIGLVTSGIGELIKAEKMHKANAEATFKPSTDAVKMFGGAVVDANPPVFDLTNALGKGLPKMAGFALETKNFRDEVSKLPKDNAMLLILNQMKDAKSDEQAKKIAQAFAATQVAINGMDPAAAQRMIDLYLAASGHESSVGAIKAPTVTEATTQLLNTGKASIGLTKGQQEAMEMYRKMAQFAPTKTQQDDALVKYNKLSKQGAGAVSSEQTAKNIKAVADSMISGSATASDYKAKIDGVKASTNDTTAAVKIYAQNLTGVDEKQKNNVSALGDMGLKFSEVIPYLKLASVQKDSPLLVQIAQHAKNHDAAALAKDMIDLNNQIDKLLNTKPKKVEIPGVGTTTLTAAEIASNLVTKLQKEYKGILDPLSARIKGEQKVVDLMNQQNNASQQAMDYATSMTDIQNQVKQKMATGDYLGANLLRQQALASTDKFNQQQIENSNAQKITKGQELFASAQESIANGIRLTPAQLKAIKNYNPKMGSYSLGSVNVPAATSYGSAAQLGTSANNMPPVNIVINGANMTQAQIESMLTSALNKAGIKAGASGTKTKVGG